MEIKGYWGDSPPVDDVKIVSTGHIYTFKDREFSLKNGGDDYLLMYVYRGDESFFIDDKEIILTAGTFLLYLPNQPQHHLCRSSKTGEIYYIHVKDDTEKFAELLGIKSLTPYKTIPSLDVANLFEQSIKELQLKGKNYKIACLSILTQLFIKVNRIITNSEPVEQSFEITNLIQYMSKRYYENQSLYEYASMCSLSVSHFLKQFKAITGITPMSYRTSLRMHYAKELLKSSKHSIKYISQKLGYMTTAHFSGVFKNTFGMSPTEYRIQNKNNNKSIH